MKIALFFQSLQDGGVQHVMINMYKELKIKKIDVELIIADAPGEVLKEVSKEDIIDLNKTKLFGDYKVLFSINKLKKIINTNNFDVIVACPGFATISLILANSLSRKKVKTVLMVDNKISLLKKGKLKHKISYYLYKKLYKYSTSIVVAHEVGRKDIISSFKLNENKVFKIYHPLIDSNLLNESRSINHKFINSSNFVILTVGRLVPEKNYELLINCFPKIKNYIPNAKLIIIGDGPEKEKLNNLICNLDLENDIDMIGFYKYPMDYMKKCNLYVLSSKQEAFGIVLVEALACKMKIVSTDCESGAQREILNNGEYGYICRCNDSEDLINKIIEAYNSQNNDYLIKNYNRGIEFSINNSVNQYIELFRRIVNE